MEFKAYKRIETFRGPVSSLPPYQYVLTAGGKIFCSNHWYNANLYCILEQAECYCAVGRACVLHVKGSRFDPQLGNSFHMLPVTLSHEN